MPMLNTITHHDDEVPLVVFSSLMLDAIEEEIDKFRSDFLLPDDTPDGLKQCLLDRLKSVAEVTRDEGWRACN